MSIQEVLEKIKPYNTLLLVAVLACIFFILGRFSALERAKTGVQIYNPAPVSYGASVIEAVIATSSTPKVTTGTEESSPTTEPKPSGEVIGSKSGKKYYFPWCGTVKRIKPENQVHFPSIEAAKAAGFTPGGNCKGLY